MQRSKHNPFMEHSFVEIEELTPERAVASLTIRPEVRNPYGMVHGGALYTLADNAAGFAAHTDGRAYVTQSSNLYFLRNQTEGVVCAEATVRRRGRTTCLVEVDITGADGALLASGTFVYFCVGQTGPLHSDSPSPEG